MLHASEIQELQIRIEEEGEKVKTAETLAGALRAELAEVRDTGAGQEAELQHARQELRLARQEVDLLRVGAAGAGVPGLEEVLELSRGVATVRRQYQEMRHETVKEINRMKIEMAERARQLSTACLEVYTDSQYVRDSQGNKILVGDIRECWEKLERVKLEKKVEEERADYQRIRSNCLGSGGGGGQLSLGRPRPLVPGFERSASAGRRSRSSDNVQVTAAVQAALNTRQTQKSDSIMQLNNSGVAAESQGAECEDQRPGGGGEGVLGVPGAGGHAAGAPRHRRRRDQGRGGRAERCQGGDCQPQQQTGGNCQTKNCS